MMNLLTASKTLFLAFGLMLVSITSQAGQKDFGEYQVHWSVPPQHLPGAGSGTGQQSATQPGHRHR